MITKPYIEYMRLDDYLARFHPRNPKEHDIGGIITSILRFGFVENPTIDEGTSYVAAGHGRGEGLEQIRTKMQFSQDDLKHHNGLYQHESGAILPKNIDLAPDAMWLLPIVRGITFKDEAHVNAYLIASNRLVQLGGWDNQGLAEMLQELAFDADGLLEATGYDGDDLDLLLQDLGQFGIGEAQEAPEAQIDKAQELQEKWQVKKGDLFQIGKHRLLCGDSTNEADVKRLMGGENAEICFTSPPYADQRDYSENSDLSIETLKHFISASKDYVNYFCVNLGIKRSNYEIVPYWDEYIAHAKECGLKLLSWNVWDKLGSGSIGNQLAMFPIEHEFIFVFGESPKDPNRIIPHSENSAKRRKYDRTDEQGRKISSRRQPDGSMSYSTIGRVFDKKPLPSIIRNHAEKGTNIRQLHPAVMSPEPIEPYLLAITDENDFVYEPFAGSGTTAVACEQLKRQCRMMEIEPKYCSVILQRLSDMGLTPELIES